MTLPPAFPFSQRSLQDYLDCPRRFQLRYLWRQPWPAVESEPLAAHERALERGRRFHQLVHQHTLGLPQAALQASIDDPQVRRWWRHYLESPPPNLPLAVRRSEITLTTPLSTYRLAARYDLVAVEPGQRAIIVDWKTGRSRPPAERLRTAVQTRVYCYVLVQAGSFLNADAPLSPSQVEMVYWFAEHPAHPVTLPYDEAQHADDAAYLEALVAEVAARAAADDQEWPLTPDERRCRFCTYRSLCARGVAAGPLDALDADDADPSEPKEPLFG